MPNDPRAALWPGSGRTLYGMGQKSTRAVIEKIAEELGLIEPDNLPMETMDDEEGEIITSGSWLKRVFS